MPRNVARGNKNIRHTSQDTVLLGENPQNLFDTVVGQRFSCATLCVCVCVGACARFTLVNRRNESLPCRDSEVIIEGRS